MRRLKWAWLTSPNPVVTNDKGLMGELCLGCSCNLSRSKSQDLDIQFIKISISVFNGTQDRG